MDEVNINMGSSFNHKRINHHSSVEQERALIWKKTCDNSDAKDSLLIKKELCGGHLLIRYFSFHVCFDSHLFKASIQNVGSTSW